MASANILSTHSEGFTFETRIDNHIIRTGMPAKNGSTSSGVSPKSLMLVSLAGCTGIDIVMILEKMKVEYSNFNIAVDAELTETDPKTYHKVLITYTISIKDEDKSRMEKAVNLSMKKYCGVSAMFNKFAELESKILFI